MRQARYWLVLTMALLMAGNMAIPAAATLVGADLVGGIGASKTPKAGKLLPLDAHVKFPNSVLRTGHRGGIDSDKLDGLHGTSYARRDHNHDNDYVNAGGDTMTGTLSAPDFTYSTPKIGRLRVPAAGFVGDGAAPLRANNGLFVMAGNSQDLYTPIQLPNGVKILQARYHYLDSTGTPNLAFTVLRSPASPGSGPEVLSTATTSGSPGQAVLEDNTLLNYIVDNDNWAYWLQVAGSRSDGTTAVESLEIVYTYTSPGR